MRVLFAALDDATIDAAECERLVGFVLLCSVGHAPGDARTQRRRWARLEELGAIAPDPGDVLALELGEMVARGEITALEAEIRAGRFLLARAGLAQRP